MSVITDEIVTHLSSNAGDTGQEIRDALSTRKTHAIKHGIANLLETGIIQVDTADTSTDFRQWNLDTYSVI